MNTIFGIIWAAIYINYSVTSINPAMIPKNNSHYIEGLSRYIWWEDERGNLRLEDLWNSDTESNRKNYTPRLGDIVGNKYHYIRLDPDNDISRKEDILVYGDEKAVKGSYYSPKLPLIVIIPGWLQDWNGEIPNILREVFVMGGYNVITCDWSYLGGLVPYKYVVDNIEPTGVHLARFIEWLLKVGGGSFEYVHIVGFDMGAHIAGIAGRTTGGKPKRITGLDPAGPLFQNNENCIKPTDGQYVEIIHSRAGFKGIDKPVGRVDFYPNVGGYKRRQPGCAHLHDSCSHKRAAYLFEASVRVDIYFQKPILYGYKCNNLTDALTDSTRCTGEKLRLGTIDLNKQGSGIYGLVTKGEYPYDY